jgi:hypothetical protein
VEAPDQQGRQPRHHPRNLPLRLRNPLLKINPSNKGTVPFFEGLTLGRLAGGTFFDRWATPAVPVTHAVDAIRPAFAGVGVLGSG